MLEQLEQEVAIYIKQLFEQIGDSTLPYHNYHHTEEVVARAKDLGQALDKKEQRLLAIAAWFHDIGYLYTYEEHEYKAMQLAQAYLENKKKPIYQINLIVNCIEATKLTQEPRNLLEQIIKDADIGFGLTQNFFQTGVLLRKEWELQLGKSYSDKDWEQLQLDFLKKGRFYSPIGQEKYTPYLINNIALQEKRIQ